MSRNTLRTRAGERPANLYTEITDKIIAELEAGRIPWVQPWGTAAIDAPLNMPRNASTQRRYFGKRSGCPSCNGQRFSRS
jgi:antirestriction protein ArdC